MIATTSLTITGIVKIITTSPVKDFLISLAAGCSWDGIKKIVSHFSENSTEKKMEYILRYNVTVLWTTSLRI